MAIEFDQFDTQLIAECGGLDAAAAHCARSASALAAGTERDEWNERASRMYARLAEVFAEQAQGAQP